MIPNLLVVPRGRLVGMALALLLGWWGWCAYDAAGGAESTNSADEILRSVNLPNGLIVHLNSGDGNLTVELSQRGKFLVQGLETDATLVDKARRTIEQHKLSGKVSVLHWSGKRLPYASNLVNVLIAEHLGDVPEHEVLRVLRPHGIARIKRQGVWTTLTKPWPKEMDDWTHKRHGSNGNPVSKDTLLTPSLRPQWLEGPLWCREAFRTTLAMVSSGGRLFYVIDEVPAGMQGISKYSLIARDAFNGLLLWKRPIRGFFAENLIAVDNRVFVSIDGELLALDADSGKVVHSFGKKNNLCQIVHVDGILILNMNSSVVAVGANKGEFRWKQDAKKMRQLIASEGRVFGMDIAGQLLLSYDLKTGKELWRKEFDKALLANIDFCQDGLLVLARETFKEKEIVCLSADRGTVLWRHEVSAANRRLGNCLMYANGMIWVNAHAESEKNRIWKGLEPRTGKVQKTIEYPYLLGITHSCFPDYATERFLITGRMGFADLVENKFHFSPVFRGACLLGRIPANGMLYSFPHACQCYPMDRGVLGLAPRIDVKALPAILPEARLHKGPAFGEAISAKATLHDWPTWRHDERRSGSTSAQVPAELRSLWSVEFPGAVSAPVVAEGTLLVAAKDVHQIIALDADTGKARWTYTADARIDSPPTIYQGLALFGSRDGKVHCVRLSDGKLVWRFHAAPSEQLIMAGGQLESSWPVSGSILIAQDTAYFAVGRLADPADGPCIFALDPRTGKILREENTKKLTVCDVMTVDRQSVHLGEFQFDLARKPDAAGDWKGHLKTFCLERAGAHHTLLDDSWYQRRDISDDRGNVAQKLVFSRERTYGFIVGEYAPGKKNPYIRSTQAGQGGVSAFRR